VEDSDTLVSNKLDIDTAALGYFCTTVKDKPGEYRLIPVWDFSGTETGKSDVEKTLQHFDKKDWDTVRKQIETEDQPHRSETSLLTMNAIDGSIIDRSVGY
jgi:hypothetical protein